MHLISALPLGLALLLVQACSAARGRVTLHQPSTRSSHFDRSNKIAAASSSAMLIPRGGDIVPLMSPDAAVKTFLGADGLNGITGVLTPEWHMKTYLMDIDDYTIFLVQEAAAVDTVIILLLGLQLFKGMSFEKAVGWSTLPYIFMTVTKLLKGDHKKVGCPTKNGYLVLIINEVVALASIQGRTFAIPIIKVYALFSLINSAAMLFAPEKAGENWNLVPKTSQIIAVVALASIFRGPTMSMVRPLAMSTIVFSVIIMISTNIIISAEISISTPSKYHTSMEPR